MAHRLRARWDLVILCLLIVVVALLTGAAPFYMAGAGLVGLCMILVRGSEEDSADNDIVHLVGDNDVDPAQLAEVAFSAAFAALDLPCVVFEANGAVLFQNGAAETMFGRLETGMHISARWRSPGILDMVRETVASGQPNQIEHSEVLPSERVFHVRVAPLAPSQKILSKPQFVMSFRDISELRRLDRMRSDFVANASHELRTPLASLRGFIETLLGPARNDHKAQERFLSIMLDQANRMSRLVDDLLSLSRLELKAHIAPEQKVDLVPVLNHVRDTLSPLANELDMEIVLHLPDMPVEVTGDRDELIQVFENLMENACKYGQDGKIVEVFLRRRDSVVDVSIVDRGPGIPADHVPRLTERFYRVSVADSRSKKGTGLGLAIVKHILTRHRARLIIRSELDKGSDFTVRF
ncbi:phosphate regulon sensor histidine kinase PhoR [Allorhizobium sonneratiae]|uniref:phosphate regulon sensor histidine kinase PhoR n=1 Tax=Allorhizobium sonneratiae TaxID=2934936 RepID=UPI003B845823